MKAIWDRIEKWIEANAPAIMEDIKPGASESDFGELERMIKATLPADVKSSYAIHDGQVGHSSGIIDGEELLCLGRIMQEWSVWEELWKDGEFKDSTSAPAAGIKDDWWNPLWIPITYDGAGNHYCIDLDPAEGGNVGQIIRMWHDEESRELIASSFTEFMTSFADDLEQGKYVSDEDGWGGLVKKEEAEE